MAAATPEAAGDVVAGAGVVSGAGVVPVATLEVDSVSDTGCRFPPSPSPASAADASPAWASPVGAGEVLGDVDAASPSSGVTFGDNEALGGGTVRSLWQYRHLMAASWISSAQ